MRIEPSSAQHQFSRSLGTDAGRLVVSPGPFNGVKVFSATITRARELLGEEITTWMSANPLFRIVEFVVTQSSDAYFHCTVITVFYAAP